MAAVTTCSDSAAQIIIGAQINFGAQIIKMCLSSWSYWLKKKHMTVKWRLYLGKNEDYSLGDTISDSSEGLLWRGKRGAQYIYINDFGEGRYMQSSTHFGIRSLLVTRSLQPVVRSKSLLVILMFFYIWEDSRNWPNNILYLFFKLTD